MEFSYFTVFLLYKPQIKYPKILNPTFIKINNNNRIYFSKDRIGYKW